MAEAKCPCCEGHEFEVKTVRLSGPQHERVQLIACATCGAVAGALQKEKSFNEEIADYLNS